MKRYMWHASFRVESKHSMGVSCSDPLSLVRDALRLNANSITLHRLEEIKGKLPTLMEMRGIVKSVKGDDLVCDFAEHKVGGPKLAKNDPLMKASVGWGSTTHTYRGDPRKPRMHPKGQEFHHVVNFEGKKAPRLGWKKVK